MGQTKETAEFLLPPTVHRRWDNNDDLLNIVFVNTVKKKGITLRTTRPIVVFIQTIKKFWPEISPAELREGVSLLNGAGVTFHDVWLCYLAYDDEDLPSDELHEVSPSSVMFDEPFMNDIHARILMTIKDTSASNDSSDTPKFRPI